MSAKVVCCTKIFLNSYTLNISYTSFDRGVDIIKFTYLIFSFNSLDLNILANSSLLINSVLKHKATYKTKRQPNAAFSS